jgi:PAS domain S-box-containing protein
MNEQTASDERFRALVTATSDVVYRLSPDWEIMYELDGRGFLKSTSEPITGWRERNVHRADMDMVNAAIAKAIDTKTMFELEHRVVRADGSTGWTISRAVPIIGANGEITEWFGAASDISLRKFAEEELLAAKQQAVRQQQIYETVTANTPDLVYVFSLDYKFTYVNKALLEMWGKRWEDAVGKGLLENGYEPWHAAMHEREIDQVVATRKAVRGEVAFPHAILGRRIYDYILNPVFGTSGEVVAVSGTTRDVTDRKMEELERLKLSDELAALNEEAQATNEELRATNDELIASQDLLREANNKLAQLLNMLPASVVVIRGKELIVEMINDSNLKYWGKTKEQVIGKPFLEILPDLADQPFAGQLRKVMDTGEIIDVKESPVLFENPDGSIRETYVDYTYQPLSDSSGNRNGVLVMSFEITDRVRSRRLLEQYTKELGEANNSLSISNNKLAKSESRFKFLIQEAPVAIGVLHGKDLVIETANGKLLEVWGKADSVIGLPLAKALPEIDGQPFLGILDSVFEKGEAFYANEIRALLAHGGQLRELFFNLVYQPISGIDGEVADILVVAVDVTQQVNARKQIEQSEQHFRKLADLVPAKISNALPNGEVTFFNQKWLDFSGMGFDDLRAFGYHQMMHPDEIPVFQRGLEAAAGRKAPYVSEMRFKNTKGEYVWHLNVTSPVLDEQGNIAMWVGSTTDIQTIKEEEQRKNDFIGMVSHELKTPLTSLNGYLQLLQRKAQKEGDSYSAHAFDHSLKQVRQMNAMINGFLNVSRLESGKIHIEKTSFDLAELIQEIQGEHQLLYTSHDLIFHPVGEIIVSADREKIAQVVNNLVSNAVKYSAGGTVVDVTCKRLDDKVRISVRDRGIGIDEDDLLRLFERYYRVEQNSNIAGFGIGLYLSAEIIARHGGKIWGESEIAKGSTFHFELPLA